MSHHTTIDLKDHTRFSKAGNLYRSGKGAQILARKAGSSSHGQAAVRHRKEARSRVITPGYRARGADLRAILSGGVSAVVVERAPAQGREGSPAPNVPASFDDAFPSDEFIAEAATAPRSRVRGPPSAKIVSLYASWNDLLPMLARPMLERDTGAHVCALCPSARQYRVVCVTLEGTSGRCAALCGESRPAHCDIGFKIRKIASCEHQSMQQAMVRDGYFPSGPQSGGYGYSLKLLDLFIAMSARSSISALALAAALHDSHRRRGYVLRDRKVPGARCRTVLH